jgi:hypothetical protein
MQDGWTLCGCTQFVEYLRIRSEKSLKSFPDLLLKFVRWETSRTRLLASRILDNGL